LADETPSTNPDVEVEPCATCGAACPVHTDTRAYVDLIAQGRYEEAFERIREFNPFPSVCSLICHHPCEQECRRQFVDEPVALRNLKRFAVEQAAAHREATRQKAAITQDKTVGVVGSGPAGLTVAKDCILQGYAVTVYESLPRPGGVLACGIPKYRLPDEALGRDIDDILALGVDVQTGVAVGKDVTLDELRHRHDAVVLAIGLSDSRDLPLGNHDHPDVILAMPFLRAAALGQPMPVREQVIIIGGGNVAVDAARTAMRLGADTVKMVCLEDEDEMPAWDWECHEALEEGIDIIHRRGPTKVVVENGELAGLVVREVARVFDDTGRFAPTYFDDRLSTLPGQQIIISIGQQSDFGVVEGTDVERTDRGLLVFDRATMSTTAPGVFACGEVVTGPGSAIEAVASGHRAAQAALAYIETGHAAPVEAEEVDKVGELPQEIIDQVRRIERVAMPALSPEERRKSFVQFELGYDEKMALTEARRCLSCTAGATVDSQKCASCLTCLRICPYGVPAIRDDVAVMCSEMCQACGLCAVECPAVAIRIKRFAVGDIRDRIIALVEGSEQPVTRVEIACAQDAEHRDQLRDRVETLNGDVVATVPVPCAARADEVDMMKPFELGVSSVVVRLCSTCRYRGADERLARRVGRTQTLLDAAGIGGDKLSLV